MADLILAIRRQLIREFLPTALGAIWRVSEAVKYRVGYDQIVWGRNIAAIRAFYFGIGVVTDVQDEPTPPVAMEDNDDVQADDALEATVDETPVMPHAPRDARAPVGSDDMVGAVTSETAKPVPPPPMPPTPVQPPGAGSSREAAKDAGAATGPPDGGPAQPAPAPGLPDADQ